MVLGMLIGVGAGTVAGIAMGSQLFSTMKPTDFGFLDRSADDDPDVPDPVGPVRPELRPLLEFAPQWAKWPDFDRVLWMNRMIYHLFPHLNRAILKEVNKAVGPILNDTVKQVAVLEKVEIEELTLGTRAMYLGGVKLYRSSDDEVSMELPLMWGSDMKLRVSATVRVGPFSIYIPLEAGDIQIKALTRVTLKPLVEQLPCLGGVSVSLMEPPHIDFALRVIGTWDLMALPGVKQLVDFALAKFVLPGICLYPTSFSTEIMPNYGLPPAPAGMLEVQVARGRGLKATNPFVRLSTRAGRFSKTKTQKGSDPDFNEGFKMLVDDLENSVLRLEVVQDDGWNNNAVAVGEVSLKPADAEFVRVPRESVDVTVQLMLPPTAATLSYVPSFASRLAFSKPKNAAQAAEAAMKNVGELILEITFIPFFRPTQQQADEDDKLARAAAEAARLAGNRRGSARVSKDQKGVLTVTIRRCKNLPDIDGSMNAYVQLKLFDESDETFKDGDIRTTTPVPNEYSPRWGTKFEFVSISAASTLTCTVFDKVGMMESLFRITKKEDKPVGKVSISVADVARNKRLKDSWPLQEAEQGELEMVLEWDAIEIA